MLEFDRPMTFDEPIEKLSDRHETLNHSVELMGHRINDVITAVNNSVANIRALVRVAERHARRLALFQVSEKRPTERQFKG